MADRASELNRIYQADCLEIMSQWPDSSIDHCIADPPFGIASGNGRGGNRNGLGWAFSSHVTMQEEWDRFSKDEFFEFNVAWLREVCRLVRPNGNIFVFGTYHNIYQLGFILQNILHRKVVNSIIWYKPNAQPNITGRTLTESTEQLIWAVNETPERATNWVFNYRLAKELSDDKQMRNFWEFNDIHESINVFTVPVVPKKSRNHPSQKPLALVDRLVRLATIPNDVLLDPFAGTGVVGLSALRYRRKYILIESVPEYVRKAEASIAEFYSSKRGKLLYEDTALQPFTDQELDILFEVPVPQADDLELVFNVPEYVQQGATTRAQIASRLDARKHGYVGRQGPYYADAAMSLRLIRAVGSPGKTGQALQITPIGTDFLRSRERDKWIQKQQIVLNSPIVKFLGAELGVELNQASDITHDVLDEAKVAKALQELDISESTASRRAHTLCGWLKYISQVPLPV